MHVGWAASKTVRTPPTPEVDLDLRSTLIDLQLLNHVIAALWAEDAPSTLRDAPFNRSLLIGDVLDRERLWWRTMLDGDINQRDVLGFDGSINRAGEDGLNIS
jgi:hypothetical protein